MERCLEGFGFFKNFISVLNSSAIWLLISDHSNLEASSYSDLFTNNTVKPEMDLAVHELQYYEEMYFSWDHVKVTVWHPCFGILNCN